MTSQLTPAHHRIAHIPFNHESGKQLDSVLQEVIACISPVWPLKDYVAVNPYFGMSDRSFMSARTFLRVFSACETLMPLEYYAAQWRAGQLELFDIEQALKEIAWPQTLPPIDAEHIAQILEQCAQVLSKTIASEATPLEAIAAQGKRAHPIRCLTEHAAVASSIAWHEIVTDEVSKFCAAHFDDGQASWPSAWKHLSLYEAWHEISQVDRNAEVLGLTKMRSLVASLPTKPRAAIIDLLCRMNVPYPLWSTVLLSQVFALTGWFAWAKYQDENHASESQPETFASLLAIRLAYDYAVGQTLGLQVDWNSYLRNGYASFQCEATSEAQISWIRYMLLRATELRYRQRLLSRLPSVPATKQESTTAQLVFCIDVRSERMRRHLESQSNAIETFGFAGFFGLPIEFQSLGEHRATSQLPVLLKPQHRVCECLADGDCLEAEQAQHRRTTVRGWRKLWQSFKSSAIGSFGFVEVSGLLASLPLLSQSLGLNRPGCQHRDGLRSAQDLRPGINQSLSIELQVDMTAKILTNLGLTRNFSRLVVFCGHHSQTHNNPLAAGLDCGACGGHSGAPNARILAAMLNQTDVRLGLCQRGLVIPPDTHFMAAAHNTTTDAIEFFDLNDLPESHRVDFEELNETCQAASKAVRLERMPLLDAKKPLQLLRRALDWSEVRPEWGLAGNAAFIVGPRSWTMNIDLNGQAFLHSYNAEQDPSGAILESIMTAPMIVANWINMQYYASTVDNTHFGSGNKTIHNVVGRFGILSGNSGDLQTGLPLQSLHDGHSLRHQPLRLLVVICAPRASIERVYHKHELVANLVNNEWLSIVAMDEGGKHKLCGDGRWEVIP